VLVSALGSLDRRSSFEETAHVTRVSMLQCVAVCCSVLQCVAVCCSALQRVVQCVSGVWIVDHLLQRLLTLHL